MAVEQYTVTMSVNNPFDMVSAVIRGKTVPVIGQSFSLDLDGVVVSFEIETVQEKVRGNAESIYTLTGREMRSEALYRAVDFTLGMSGGNSTPLSMPTVSTILSGAGLTVVYDAMEFKPTQSAMGWTVTNGTVRIREKNVQTLLQKLFGWTSEFGKLKINYHFRNGVIYVWETQRATGPIIALTNAICTVDSLNLQSQVIRKFSESTDTNGTTVTTPTATVTFEILYDDVPYSGPVVWGKASLIYSGGLLVSSTAGDVKDDFSYGYMYGANVLLQKITESPTKKTKTLYEYDRAQAGSQLGTTRPEPALSRETTTGESIKDGAWSTDSESTVIDHSPRGDGFYGQTATRYVDGVVDQVQHSISRGTPSGAASQYTLRKEAGWRQTTPTPTTTLPGYVLAKTVIPIEDTGQANTYLNELIAMNGQTEKTIRADTVGQVALNPIQGRIGYRGLEYYATDATITRTPTSKRMTVAGIRWD